MKQEARVLIAAPNQGEVERLAGLLQEYGVAYRLGSRVQAAGSATVYSESSYLAGDLRTPVIVKTAIANGVQVLDLRDADGRATARQIVMFGAQDLSDDADVQARPVTRSKSKTAAFVSDFRDLTVGDYVVHVEHGIARYCGLRVIEENDQPPLELMILEFADEAKLVCAADAAGPDPEIPLDGHGAGAGAEQAGHAGVAEDQGAGEEGDGRHVGRAAEALRAEEGRGGDGVLAGHEYAARV
jgi:transcription-repair coupling factor (superfamily II helicase)